MVPVVCIPGGLAFDRCEGRLVSGAATPPAARPFGRAASAPRPVFLGCGCRGRGDPAPAPQRALLRGVVACCGGGGRASPGGVPCALARAFWIQALSLPWPPILSAGCRGPLPTCCERGCGAVGAQSCPFGLHALRGAVCPWGGGRPSRGGWPSTVVRGVWCQALSLHRPPILLGGQPGFHDRCVPGAAGVGVRTQQPGPAARALSSCRGALWGWQEGVPGGGAFHCCAGASEFRRCPSPGRPSFGAGSRGSATRVSPGCSWCGRGGPTPVPRPALLRVVVARCGVGGRTSSGGSAFRRCERRLYSGALPPPAAHVLWAQLCGCGGPALSPWLACPVRGCVPRGWWGAVPEGRPSTVVRGIWCQALSLPRPPVLLGGGWPAFRDRCTPGAAGVGLGTQHRP